MYNAKQKARAYPGIFHELTNLVAEMNKIHPYLKFTMDFSETEVTYLDLKIFKGERFRSYGLLEVTGCFAPPSVRPQKPFRPQVPTSSPPFSYQCKHS